MKKFLPKTAKNPQGFTLVELLVVVSIIAILTVIGIAVFINVSGKARDARRKADIKAIASAYEANYNQEAGTYRPLMPSDFTGGTIPTPPEGGTLGYRYVRGPSATVFTPSTLTFKVCAALEGNTNADDCINTLGACYCVSAAYGTSSTSPTSCTTLSSQNCQVKNTAPGGTALPTSGSIYINCPTATTLDCTVASPSDSVLLTIPSYFTVSHGGTVVNTSVNIYRVGLTTGDCASSACTLLNVQPYSP